MRGEGVGEEERVLGGAGEETGSDVKEFQSNQTEEKGKSEDQEKRGKQWKKKWERMRNDEV